MPKASAPKQSVSKDGAETTILEYLKAQNRPYSAIDVYNNLHAAIGKTAVVKALASMQESGLIAGKAYGKQLVYVARQDQIDLPDDAELKEMDEEIKSIDAELQALKETVKSKQAKVNNLKNQMSTALLKQEIDRLSTENKEKADKLAKITQNTIKVDQASMDLVQKRQVEYQKEGKKRKKVAMEVINMILENAPIEDPKSWMTDTLGLELDEK